MRQLTTGRYHDVSDIYLPGGNICFCSTRSESYSMCQAAPGCAMFVMDPSGGNIRRIEFSTLGDYSPAVMADGRVLFMRWEYNDRSLFTRQSLWTINPNGTSVRLFYGNTLVSPNVLWQAREIPGSDKVICTMAPHHGWPSGAIGMIDQRLGVENTDAITNLTPSIRIPVSMTGPYGPGDAQHQWAYLDPWPLDEKHCLVAYGGPEPKKGLPGRYRLVMLEPGEKLTPLCQDPNYYGTYENTRPHTPGSRDIWTGPWFGEVTRLLNAGKRMKPGEPYINVTHPEFSRVLVDHLPKSAGGRGMAPAFFGPDDPDYRALLAAIRQGHEALIANPRMDMPGARPLPYPTDFGKLHAGFAGP
jgi:hypothetical protein